MDTKENGKERFRSFYGIALFNLFLVAAIGTLLRYKMVASLPWVNHKFFLHGHSHFAFAGWISLVLMTAITQKISSENPALDKPLRNTLRAHLVAAYGMLLTFPVGGYAPLSILFSTLSILISYFFVWKVWKTCTQVYWGNKISAFSIKAALAFLVISSLGAFWLAGLMATGSGSQPLYFSALYFFLHFQYNGWFFFGILGLAAAILPLPEIRYRKKIFQSIRWLAYACIPAILLSVLWLKLPAWIYYIASIAGLWQLLAVVRLYTPFREWKKSFLPIISEPAKWLFGLAFISFLLRVFLQALSTIPALSKFAFGYRPVVIGYLHLILIGCISFFLLGFLHYKKVFINNGAFKAGLLLFITGFLLTEITLMLQGFGYIGWITIPFTNQSLFTAAIFLVTGTALLVGSYVFDPKKYFTNPAS
jgi:hypothetical protein